MRFDADGQRRGFTIERPNEEASYEPCLITSGQELSSASSSGWPTITTGYGRVTLGCSVNRITPDVGHLQLVDENGGPESRQDDKSPGLESKLQ